MLKQIYLNRLLSSIIICLSFSITLQAQLKADSVIDKGIYKSYFSFALKNPLYVTYFLFKGGGPCDRQAEHMSFVTDGCNRCARTSDYTNSNFEKGHLANAEDFAFNCAKEKLTFRYYNCVPQTFELNHGAWLQWEDSIRQLSQTKRIFIIAGSIFGKKTIGKGKVRIPTSCYKILVEPITKKILGCWLFPNDNSGSVTKISLMALKKKLGYALLPQPDL